VQSEHGRRLLTIESGIASLRREQAGDAETVVNVQAQIDRLREEVQRIKRRLELAP
jgi:septal ring factor EnvC (AmiA/AmiB activator)